MASDVDGVTVTGRLFQTRDAATGKARSPMVEQRVGGKTSALVDVERRCIAISNKNKRNVDALAALELI